jgi:hypothetical protein
LCGRAGGRKAKLWWGEVRVAVISNPAMDSIAVLSRKAAKKGPANLSALKTISGMTHLSP